MGRWLRDTMALRATGPFSRRQQNISWFLLSIRGSIHRLRRTLLSIVIRGSLCLLDNLPHCSTKPFLRPFSRTVEATQSPTHQSIISSQAVLALGRAGFALSTSNRASTPFSISHRQYHSHLIITCRTVHRFPPFYPHLCSLAWVPLLRLVQVLMVRTGRMVPIYPIALPLCGILVLCLVPPILSTRIILIFSTYNRLFSIIPHFQSRTSPILLCHGPNQRSAAGPMITCYKINSLHATLNIFP